MFSSIGKNSLVWLFNKTFVARLELLTTTILGNILKGIHGKQHVSCRKVYIMRLSSWHFVTNLWSQWLHLNRTAVASCRVLTHLTPDWVSPCLSAGDGPFISRSACFESFQLQPRVSKQGFIIQRNRPLWASLRSNWNQRSRLCEKTNWTDCDVLSCDPQFEPGSPSGLFRD